MFLSLGWHSAFLRATEELKLEEALAVPELSNLWYVPPPLSPIGWSTPPSESEVCKTVYEKQCKNLIKKNCVDVPRQQCTTVKERECNTVYNEVCVDEYRTEYDTYTETQCSTEYKEDCEYRWEGEGYEKVWAPIPGTCKQNP